MNQKGFANIILIILVVILAGVLAFGYLALVKKSSTFPTTKQEVTPLVTTQTPEISSSITPNNTPSQNPPSGVFPTGWKTYKDDKYGFEFKYPADLLTPVSVNQYNVLPSTRQTAIAGVKLISASRVKLLGTNTCGYGLKGGTSDTCDAAKEDGIGFYVVQKGYDEGVNSLSNLQTLSSVTVNGQYPKYYTEGVEGDNTDHFPFSYAVETSILVVTHDYHTISYNPDYLHQSLFLQILSTLKFTP